MNHMTGHVDGLRRHGPDRAARGARLVGAPTHSYAYGVGAIAALGLIAAGILAIGRPIVG